MRVTHLQLWEEPREQWLRSVLVVSLIFLNVADVLTTQMVLARGGSELNPVSSWLIAQGLLPSVKLAVAAFIAVAVAAVPGVRKVSSVLAPVVAAYAAVVFSNTAQLILAG